MHRMPDDPRPRLSRRHLIEGLCVAPLALATSGARLAPHRYPRGRGHPRVRTPHVPRALHVRRAIGGSRDDPERAGPGTHGGRCRGLGIRVDDPGQRLGVSEGLAGRRPERDDGARRVLPRRDGGLRRGGASPRPLARARAGVPAGGRGPRSRAQPRASDPQAVHAGGGEPVRCGHPRRLWQGVRREQLRHVLEGAHAPGSLARPRPAVRRRVPRPLRARPAAPDDAGLPFRGARATRSSHPT